MVAGNLLLESETFRLPEEEVPFFAKRFDALIETIATCRKNKDTICGKGDLCELAFLGKSFHQYYNPLSFAELAERIPEFTRDQFQFLMYELLKYDADIIEGCICLAELGNRFEASNNGLIGLESTRFSCSEEFIVYDQMTWHKWKAAYLTKYPQRIDWDKSTHPYLPNLTYSNLLLSSESRSRFGGNDHTDFYAKAGHTAGSDMIALSLEVGKIIAEANFYQYDDRVSKLNNNSGQIRNIFSQDKNGRKVYLSIDVDNAAFEVCNHTGKHQGEYPFDGGVPKDAKDNHDIKV